MTFMAFPSQISSEIKRGLNAIATQQQNTAACRTEDVDSVRARHSPGHCLFVLQISLWRHMLLMMMMIMVTHGEANLQRLMLHEN